MSFRSILDRFVEVIERPRMRSYADDCAGTIRGYFQRNIDFYGERKDRPYLYRYEQRVAG